MSGFQLQRLGMIMDPEPGNAHEVEGTLNPGVVRGPDGELYLFPRLVARGNYSRIGIARFGSTTSAIRAASSGSVSRSSLKLTTSGVQAAVEAAKMRASLIWNHSSAM